MRRRWGLKLLIVPASRGGAQVLYVGAINATSYFQGNDDGGTERYEGARLHDICGWREGCRAVHGTADRESGDGSVVLPVVCCRRQVVRQA